MTLTETKTDTETVTVTVIKTVNEEIEIVRKTMRIIMTVPVTPTQTV